jgi:pyruvate kinase
VQLKVKETTDTDIYTEVINGGSMRSRRGVNVPDAALSVSSLTAKDRRDVLFGIEQRVDIITLSFVREAKDIYKLRKLLAKTPTIMIAAKIETKAAIENLDEILEAADAIMVARGDLAIEVPTEKVPLLQKKIIRAANKAGKPVITATQMLDSMRISTVPTRAEVNDVANAILDGTDAVMLSDETAIGEHPIRAVRTMSRIAVEVESSEYFAEAQVTWDFRPVTRCDAVSRSISKTAIATKARAIVAFSESGYTGRMVARYRPLVPILVLTPSKETFNKSLLTYACEPILVHRVKHLTDARRIARKALTARALCAEGDVFVLGAGIPFGKPGSTNTMLVEHI